MRAAFFSPENGFVVRQVPRCEPGPDDVLIEVHACGICGSDLHFFTGAAPPPAVCPGHEICGRVAGGATNLAIGTPVAVEPLRSCGICAPCTRAEPNLCPRLEILGSRLPGGFADAVVVPSAAVYPLPEGLSLGTAMLTEPTAVAVHAVDLAALAPGATVLVLGAGVIGALVTRVAHRHAAAVTVSARHPHQAATVRRLGAVDVVASDAVTVRAHARAHPPDVVFETVGGTADTLDLALECVRPGGRIVTLGVFIKPPTLHPIRFLAKEARLLSSMMYRRGPRPDFAIALEILRDDAALIDPIVTHRVPLEDIGRGFALAGDKRSGAMKVRVDVNP